MSNMSKLLHNNVHNMSLRTSSFVQGYLCFTEPLHFTLFHHQSSVDRFASAFLLWGSINCWGFHCLAVSLVFKIRIQGEMVQLKITDIILHNINAMTELPWLENMYSLCVNVQYVCLSHQHIYCCWLFFPNLQLSAIKGLHMPCVYP